MIIGVVVALEEEARALLPRGDLHHEATHYITSSVGMRLCGMGPEKAAQAARALLAEGATALVSYGVAGALAPGLAPGALLLPERVAFLGSCRGVDVSWRERVQQRLAPEVNLAGDLLLTLKEPAATVLDKARLRRETGAVAVDMESGAVLAAAAAAGVPGLVLRAIVDSAETSLPRAALGGLDGQGRPRVAAVIQALLRRPWELAAVLRLSVNLRAAVHSLRRAWLRLGPEGLAP
ncbi:MAG: hypothetical protein KGJ12_01765 [Gammaproteobacteria bacterium]|nr:hypothetical protein [Gammaproteobacteria bacterium]